MAVLKGSADLNNDDVWKRTHIHCPACGWYGRGRDVVCPKDDLVRCPKCGKPVERVTLCGLPVVETPPGTPPNNTRYVLGNPLVVEAPEVPCTCGCHTRPGMMHMFPCCEGSCSRCGRYFKSGLPTHAAACGGEPRWSSSDRRAAAEKAAEPYHEGVPGTWAADKLRYEDREE